jgi:hypothetical protein
MPRCLVEIDKAGLADRLRNGGALSQHERDHLADLLKAKKPKHRPRASATTIKADKIARLVFFLEALGRTNRTGRGPYARRKAIFAAVAKWCRVSPRYVGMVMHDIDSEKVDDMKAWAAIAFAPGGSIAFALDDDLTDLTVAPDKIEAK